MAATGQRNVKPGVERSGDEASLHGLGCHARNPDRGLIEETVEACVDMEGAIAARRVTQHIYRGEILQLTLF